MQLVVGQILRPHGVRGEVLVRVTTDEPQLRYAAGTLLSTRAAAQMLAAGPVPAAGATPSDRFEPADHPGSATTAVVPTLCVESARPHQDWLIIAFEGICDRDAAEALRGVSLYVDSADVALPTDPDEYHDFQLVGLAAVDDRRQRLGEVIRVEHAPGADRLVVRLTGGKQVLVPFVHAIVPDVDLAAGIVVLTPPEGLFDL